MSKHHDRIPSRTWEILRRQVFDRDGWRCRACGRPGRLECDHVVPIDKGGAPLDPDNLQTLCRGCHVAKTRGESKPPDPERERWRAFVRGITGTIG